jgi:S1-C subfamily serine protease
MVLMVPVSGCGLCFAKTEVLKASAEGRLKVGMTAEEVPSLIGNPDNTKGAMAGSVPVDMWVYRQTSGEDRTNYLAATGVTFGLWRLVPVSATEPHYVMFVDGKVVSWDAIPRSIPVPGELADDRPGHGRIITGSGFAVGRGYYLTNNHVVPAMGHPTVYDRGDALPVTVALRDQANDVALLRVSDSSKAAGPQHEGGLTFGDPSTVKQGDRVWTLGFPLTNVLGQKPILTEGTISSTYGFGEDPRLFQVSVPIQPGNSGGPLLNERGEVVGLAVSTINAAKIFQVTGMMPQNINFAVKVTYAKSLLALPSESEKPLLSSLTAPTPPRLLSELVDVVRPHVVLIKDTPSQTALSIRQSAKTYELLPSPLASS